MARSFTRRRRRVVADPNLPIVILITGFLGLLGALLSAHGAPTTTYEVDIYGATPTAFWIGVGVAYAAFLLTWVLDRRAWNTTVGLLLGGGATTAIVALPLIRGYHFYGRSDAMTHLGWVRSLEAGSLDVVNFVYPGSHSLSVIVHQTTGLDVPFSLMLVVLSFVVVFLVFVPLSAYALTGDLGYTAVAGFSAFLLLPINNIATELPYFPFLLATFFFATTLYLVVKHLTLPQRGGAVRWGWSAMSPTSVLIPITSAGVLFLHPQAAMDVLAVVGGIVIGQLAARRYRPDHPLTDTRLLHGQFVFLLIIFVVWSSHQGAAIRTAEQIGTSIEMALVGSEEGQFLHTATSRTESASRTGTSPAVLFAKLFLVSTVYLVLGGVAAAAALSGTPDADRRSPANVVTLFAISGVPLVVVSFFHTFGGISGYLYRHIGFVLLIATLLGAVGVLTVSDRVLGRSWPGPLTPTPVRGFVAVLAATALVLSLLTVFPSPYILNPSHQLTEAEADGYEVALRHKPDAVWNAPTAVWFGSVRQGPERYRESRRVTYPREHRIVYSGPVPNSGLFDLAAHYRTHREPIVRRDHYLPVLHYDVARETVAYRELRYTREGLAAIEDQPAIHRIQDNGELRVYYVDIDLYEDSGRG